MGIEPTWTSLPELENKRFDGMADPKCDWRVNFRGMWGHVRVQPRKSSKAARSATGTDSFVVCVGEAHLSAVAKPDFSGIKVCLADQVELTRSSFELSRAAADRHRVRDDREQPGGDGNRRQ
jgi:hypothetical protein